MDKSRFAGCSPQTLHSLTQIAKSFNSMRPAQREVFSPDYSICCVSSGRGWGKSFVASAWLATKMVTVRGAKCVVIGRTLTDVKQILIENQDTGIFRYLPQCNAKELYSPKNYWNRAEHKIVYENGSTLTYYGANDADKLRGSNNLYCVFDEFSSSQGGVALWNDIQMTMRVKREDAKPQVLAISTPMFGGVTEVVHKMADKMIRGSTYDNQDHLSESFIEQLKEQFGGSSLEKLELYGEVSEIQNALANSVIIEQHREEIPDAVDKRVIAVDPAVEAGSGNSETGIVVLAKRGEHLYVESDMSATKPLSELTDLIVDVAHKRNAAVVIETNQGGALCIELLRRSAKTKGLAMPKVVEVKATESKLARAEVASQELHAGNLHFPLRTLPLLESQFCGLSRDPLYIDKKARNDRIDALVHGVRHFKPRSAMRVVG